MGINLDSVHKKLDALKNASNRTSNIWKPEPGEHLVRIVPYSGNLEYPFIELYFHYNLGKRSILSPSSFGRPDPVIEFAEKLKQTGSKEDWIMGRKLEPKMRTYTPIIVRGHEKEGVKFWGFGKQVYEQILDIIRDPDYGDISDLKTGRDIVVTVKSAEEAGKNYAETSIRVKPKESAATSDASVIEKIKTQPEVVDLWPEPSYEELSNQLKSWLGDGELADDGVGDEHVTGTPVDQNDVEAAFDNLFK